MLILGVAIRHFHSRMQQKTFLLQLRAEAELHEGTQQVPELPPAVSVTTARPRDRTPQPR